MKDTDIDAIYCINLERRQDRWEAFQKNWSEYNLPISRFLAVDGRNMKLKEGEYRNNDEFHNLGSIACTLSHLQVLERMIYMNQNKVLILEDDAVPCKDFYKRFVRCYADLPEDFRFCYVGGSVIETPEKVTENIGKTRYTKSTVGYLVTLDFAKEVLPWVRQNYLNWVIDEIYLSVSRQGDPFYLTLPRLIHQSDDFSDILNRPVNYHWMKETE